MLYLSNNWIHKNDKCTKACGIVKRQKLTLGVLHLKESLQIDKKDMPFLDDFLC